jgi:hypothetical protein
MQIELYTVQVCAYDCRLYHGIDYFGIRRLRKQSEHRAAWPGCGATRVSARTAGSRARCDVRVRVRCAPVRASE